MEVFPDPSAWLLEAVRGSHEGGEMNPGPVFRPTSTQKWSRCPTLWYLTEIEGWQLPLSTWSPERDMGTALHEGMRRYWTDAGIDDQQVIDAAHEELQRLWPDTASEEYSLDGMLGLLAKTLLKLVTFFENDMEGAEAILIEQPLGGDGHTTPDLVTREHGELVVTDLKYHHHVPPDRISYRFEYLDRDHQFNHYPWAVEQYLGEPVRWFRKLGVIGSPKIVVRAEMFEITPESQAAWLQSARRKWHEMDRMKIGGPAFVYQRQEGCRPYGEKHPCPMEAACWTCYGDREQMAKFYTKKGVENA